MKILNVLPSVSLQTGGSATGVKLLCRAMAKSGHHVVLCTTSWPEERQPAPSGCLETTDDGYTVRTFQYSRSPLFPGVPHSPRLLKYLQEHAHGFDVVISHSLWNPVATFSMRILRRARLRYCVMAHGMLDPVVLGRGRWKKSPWALFWERQNVEKASLILFNTPVEEQKARMCGWRLPHSVIVPHVIDLSEWRTLPPRNSFIQAYPQVKDREVILFVGRINWVKNLDKLIDALEIVIRQRPRAALVCVGPSDEGYRAELERKARVKNLQDRLIFTGLLKDKELKAAYANGHVLVLVSEKENFGLAAAEALAAGLPVVVSTGVDLSANWESKGPVRRVTATPPQIASALLELLARVAAHSLPDPEAQSLAEKEWGQSHVLRLLETYCSEASAAQL